MTPGYRLERLMPLWRARHWWAVLSAALKIEAVRASDRVKCSATVAYRWMVSCRTFRAVRHEEDSGLAVEVDIPWSLPDLANERDPLDSTTTYPT